MSSSPIARNASPRVPWLYLAGCLLILAGALPAIWKWSTPADAQANNVVAEDSSLRFQDIETVRVGQRVVTDVAAADRPLKTSVDPATWKRVTIAAETVDAAGHPDRIVAQTLASPDWLEIWEVKLGAKIPFPFDLIEMGIPPETEGEVTAIDPCPTIPDAPGQVILSTISHQNHDVWELDVESVSGQRDTLRATGFHPFYSVDRDDHVQVYQLKEGELLQGADDLVTLKSKRRIPGYHQVFNFTVEADHVYRVGHLGVLVHNNVPCGPGGTPKGISNVPGKDFTPNPSITKPYSRPRGAGPTAEQRRAVQGKPCVECGKVTPNQVADHKDPLSVQYYREGKVDVAKQSAVDAVQAHCPTCSARQGGLLSAFVKRMKILLGL
ncbi:polymorphic toxin-type HINT domain-containing protein [Blastopirellula retiformator]|uniref:Intein C-terminal splicing domain-containing protein n=1 Tax=Blastopirellula retiformator TaxID=2527970 RepID=A0A5C5VA01_9BACT|nr:polymorphic toxin-type HINT domain-containing protein [Blastopirellula retiformator]TWT34800.1 hypothetical protein Enr8_22140 [Blastopirellula retiformator]